jgi:hypothetical protein
MNASTDVLACTALAQYDRRYERASGATTSSRVRARYVVRVMLSA